jgi:hypothetical protein
LVDAESRQHETQQDQCAETDRYARTDIESLETHETLKVLVASPVRRKPPDRSSGTIEQEG